MSRILVCDNLAEDGVKLLAEAGEVVVQTGLDEAGLIATVPGFDAILVRSATRLTAPVLEAATCRVIARAGVGVDNIDVPAATRRGILVVNSPAGNILAAAEHAVALLLSAARYIPQASASTRAGGWDRKTFIGYQIQGKTLGLVGLGSVGGEVARRARALGLNLLAHDPYVSAERAASLQAELVSLDELLAASDFVTLHTVATAETAGLIGERELALMKPGAILVNTARGSLVDETALVAALQAGRLTAAALDVFAEEPTANSELLQLPNVIATPHVGAMTKEAQVNVALDAARQVVDVLAGRPARWPVNAPALPPEAMQVVAPLLPLATALGQLGRALLRGSLQDLEVGCSLELSPQHLGYLGATALAEVLSGSADETVNAINASLLAQERGLQVRHQQLEDDYGYTSLLQLRLQGEQPVVVAGALLERSRCRIVALDGYDLDLPPEGIALLIWRRGFGRPGFIGTVGTLLGQAEVSISAIQVSSQPIDDVGLMALTVQSLVPEAVLRQLEALDGVVRTVVVQFGA